MKKTVLLIAMALLAIVAKAEVGATWHGTVEDPYFDLDYDITYNADKTLSFVYTFSKEIGAVGVPAGDVAVEFPGRTGLLNFTQESNTVFKYTTALTFNDGETVSVHIRIPRIGGLCESTFDYVVGTSNVVVAALKLTAQAQNITDSSAELAYSVTLPEALQGATVSVTCNDEPVNESPVMLSGLTPSTEYTYTLVATAALDGETYTAETTVKFQTLRSADEPSPVWYGMVKDEKFDLIYTVTYNADKTLTVNYKFNTDPTVGEIGVPKMDVNVEFIGKPGAAGLYKLTPLSNTEYEMTTTFTFEEGENVKLHMYIPRAGGVFQPTEEYVTGASNDPIVFTVAPRLTASVAAVTNNSVTIEYAVTLPTELEGATVVVTCNGNALDASPAVIADLESDTPYTFTLVATATLDGTDYACEPQELSVRTVADDFEPTVYNGYFDVTEPEQFTYTYTVTWNADRTLTFFVDLKKASQDFRTVLGMQINVNDGGFAAMTNNGDGTYTYTTKETYEKDTAVPGFFFLAYGPYGTVNPGSVRNDFSYVVGSTGGSTGIDAVAVDTDAPVVYFDIQGRRVENPASGGIYIRRQGSKVSKVMIR